MIDLAVSHWTAELERKKDTPEAAKIEKMLANATRAQEHPDTIPFGFEVGIAEIAAGEGTGFERGLAAKMSATRAALMSRDEKAGAPDKSDQGGGAKVYSDEAFVEFCREGEAIRERLGKMKGGVITFGDPPGACDCSTRTGSPPSTRWVPCARASSIPASSRATTGRWPSCSSATTTTSTPSTS